MISVISVCYNNRVGLEETWRSVQAQKCADWEWVVVDGASTDGTTAFLQTLEDPRIRWASEPDKGIYDAMNKGIERSSGDYMTFLNSGDTFAGAEVLDQVARFTEENGLPDLCYGDSYEQSAEGILLRKAAHSHRRIWYGMFTHHQAMFYRREFIGAQRYPTHYKIGGDYAFTARVLARGGRAAYLPEPLCIFEKGGVSERSAAAGRADVWDVQKEVLRMPLAARLAVRLIHVSMHRLKGLAPSLYRAARFRKRSDTP